MQPARFYCQLDYAHVPFPSPSSLNGTIADNGCGVCASCMLIEHLLGAEFPVDECARFAKQSGAREGFGTDYYILSRALAQKFNLRVEETEDAERAFEFLRERKGCAIANVRGNRESYTGVFSDGGHYIVIESVEGDEARVWDPMYTPGRYDIPGRRGKVRMDGYTALANVNVIREDCLGRHYFLFYRP